MAADVAGEVVWLLPERALFWPAAGLLVVADLHWGKAETFQRSGIPVSSRLLADDLGRLAAALDRTAARRLVVLGDLIHGAVGLTPGLVAEVAAWLGGVGAAVTLTAGNHDAHVAHLPAAWPIEVVPALREGPFLFRHEPEPDADAYVFCGHVHPTVRVGGRGGVRLPGFHLGARVGVLPAFSLFSGGPTCRLAPGDRAFGVAGARVVGPLDVARSSG
ncbi:MAG: ligase-associated DNA damage response endonuclease PdeM [Myxococcales bacterium]|nr:ligase-associated DNA damage response endonuclease PdeM [Myxococcales bacterium]